MTDHSGHRARLRERFLNSGEKGIPDYELLELVLCGVIPRGDVKPIAKNLLKQFCSLSNLLQSDVEALMAVPGVGKSVVTHLKAIAEVACRLVREEASHTSAMESWQSIIDYCRARMSHLGVEQFRLLFLDHKNQLMADEIQQQGTINRTPIFPREVVKRALSLGASSIILVHNHPSGDVTPSEADLEITRKIIQAAAALDINVLDHLIIGRFGHTSLREKRLI